MFPVLFFLVGQNRTMAYEVAVPWTGKYNRLKPNSVNSWSGP